MRKILVALGLVLCAAPADADANTRAAAQKAAKQMMEDAFVYLGAAYLCQDALGTSHYYAARSAVEQTAILGGKSQTDAVIIADDFDKRIRRDHRKKAPAENDQKCLASILATQTALRVSQARFKQARDADK
ncbi:hypothetical protein U8C36_06730 [Sinorhizobium medicae]|uniref:hypothetical protein n=1 Tax=Sinorhizobium medicae TaxID=110321 RepID=UPI002AF6CC4E|nr:hypothetical protein [Sinorhizobium medicae]WQO53303.1 hypothetical protein U8C36_06730 [Sinorhizobium medicae]WQO73999.1 hypothetical protein U8C31_06860 [Sinorhizobium medicae]